MSRAPVDGCASRTSWSYWVPMMVTVGSDDTKITPEPGSESICLRILAEHGVAVALGHVAHGQRDAMVAEDVEQGRPARRACRGCTRS